MIMIMIMMKVIIAMIKAMLIMRKMVMIMTWEGRQHGAVVLLALTNLYSPFMSPGGSFWLLFLAPYLAASPYHVLFIVLNVLKSIVCGQVRTYHVDIVDVVLAANV